MRQDHLQVHREFYHYRKISSKTCVAHFQLEVVVAEKDCHRKVVCGRFKRNRGAAEYMGLKELPKCSLATLFHQVCGHRVNRPHQGVISFEQVGNKCNGLVHIRSPFILWKVSLQGDAGELLSEQFNLGKHENDRRGLQIATFAETVKHIDRFLQAVL